MPLRVADVGLHIPGHVGLVLHDDRVPAAVHAPVEQDRVDRLAVYGHGYYQGYAPPYWYTNDTVQLSADEVMAPVRLRRQDNRVNTWTNAHFWDFDPIDDPMPKKTFDTLGPGRPYDVQPFFPTSADTQDAAWNHMTTVRSRSPETVDEWIVRREHVSDEKWVNLLTMWLGWPVIITDLPPDLFRDGTTTFDGYLWGWSMTGTDEIRMTLVPKTMFV